MRRHLIIAIALAAALFHLYAAGISPFTALVQRPIHLALMATLGFLGVGVRAGDDKRRWDVVPLAAAMVFGCIYIVSQNEALVRRVGAATPLDLAAGALTVVLVLELARRAAGWGLVSIALLALAYAFAGPWLPGFLAHRGYSATRLIEHLYLSTEGIWGIPLGVSADFVYLFVLFGAILDTAGGGELLIGLAGRVARGARGGPAKTASVASALMGSLSGSAVANVVTTGSLTIPMMKRSGFKPHMAAAIEAAASTGGQLMPPVMGAGAFILATWTNIPYLQVATAALAPALLYYAGLYMAIHYRAAQRGLDAGDMPAVGGRSAGRLHLLLPIGVIVLFLALGRSPMRAAFWGVISAALVATAFLDTRFDGAGWRRVLVAGAGGTVQVAAACATAGIVVGVASLTGIGLRMSELIITVAQGHLFVALLLTAAGSIVIGMGLPTTAAYVVLAALGAPALTQLGVPLLAAHLFIFYFGCLSNITPPVALAAYAAAGVAGASPLRTGVTAMGIAIGGFLVPFAFVYDPLLLLSGPPAAVAGTLLTAALGTAALAAAFVGFIGTRVPRGGRVLLAATGIALLAPGIASDLLGAAVFAAAAWHWRQPLEVPENSA
ncbi:MAG: TRAP transporter fused permease subunit [Acidobacteriota bacterium]|jgi:TRAP transporter 4TM/12TM fusion protein